MSWWIEVVCKAMSQNRRYSGPDPRRSMVADWAMVANIIGEDEEVTVEEADRRLTRLLRCEDDYLRLEWLPPRIRQLVDLGYWEADGTEKESLVRRRKKQPPIQVRTVFRPLPLTEEQRKGRLEERLARLERQERAPARPPVAPPRAGYVYVMNVTDHVVQIHALGRDPFAAPYEIRSREVHGGEVLEVSEEVAERVCGTGVLRRITVDELHDRMTAV